MFESSSLSSALCVDNRELLLKDNCPQLECVGQNLVELSDPSVSLCAGDCEPFLNYQRPRKGFDVHLSQSAESVANFAFSTSECVALNGPSSESVDDRRNPTSQYVGEACFTS